LSNAAGHKQDVTHGTATTAVKRFVTARPLSLLDPKWPSTTHDSRDPVILQVSQDY